MPFGFNNNDDDHPSGMDASWSRIDKYHCKASRKMKKSLFNWFLHFIPFTYVEAMTDTKSFSKVERTGAPYSGFYASSIYVTHGWLELRHTRPAVFSSIYVIGQLYLSRTVHTTKKLVHPFVLPFSMTLQQICLKAQVPTFNRIDYTTWDT